MTASEFKAFWPFGEFASVSNTVIDNVLAKAIPYFDVTVWGDLYTEGLANFVAHFVVLYQSQALKSLTQESAGDVVARAISGAVSMSRDPVMMRIAARDPFMRTTYGQQYRNLADLVGMGGVA